MVNEWPCLPSMCACVELWKAVTIFGSFNVIYSAFMMGMYSYATHKELVWGPLFRGAITYQAAIKLFVAFYCLEIIFSLLLVYGAYRRIIVCLRGFYYYALVVSVGSLMLQGSQFFTMTSRYLDYVLLGHAFAGAVFQIYLMFMVKSLLNRFDPTEHQQFENQLDEVVVNVWSGTVTASEPVRGIQNPVAEINDDLQPTVEDTARAKVKSPVSRNRQRNGDRKPILVEEIS